MSRKMRENMMDYLKKRRGMQPEKMGYMADEDIEHMYENIYFHEKNAE